MSTIQKIKSLVFLVCFIISAYVYNTILNEKEKEAILQVTKTEKKNTKNVVDSEKSSVTTIHYE